MRGRRILGAVCLLAQTASNLYFEVPFTLEKYAMTAVLVNESVQLRVHDVFDVGSQVCNASSTSTSRLDSTHAKAFQLVAAPSDRLVAVDARLVSIKSFEEIAESGAGTSHIVPLFRDADDDEVRVLSGFVRLTIAHPSSITFEPTQSRRSTAVHTKHADTPYANVAADDPDDALRFRVPFEDLVRMRCRVEAVYVQSAEAVHLRVASLDPVLPPAESLGIAVTDRLVAADKTPIALQQLDALLDGEPGTRALLPLVDNAGQGNQLSGFVLVEVLNATTIVFEPFEPSRVAALKQLAAANPSHPQVLIRDEASFAAPAGVPEAATRFHGTVAANGSTSVETTSSKPTHRPKSDVYQLPLVVNIAQDDDDDSLRADGQGNDVADAIGSSRHHMQPTDGAALVNHSTRVEINVPAASSASPSSDHAALTDAAIAHDDGDEPVRDGSGSRSAPTEPASAIITPVRIEDNPHVAVDSLPSAHVMETAPELPVQVLSVADQRKLGAAFEFDVVFPTKTRLGINWNADVGDRTVIDSVEPHSPAAALDCLEPRDHLIAINGVNVRALGPTGVVPVYISSSWPKTLRFGVEPATAVALPPAASDNKTETPAPLPTAARHHDFPLAAHADVPGVAFWYEVTLPDVQSPVGIYWDLNAADFRTVVHGLEPGSVAHRLNVMEKGDQLLFVNEDNVTALGPRDALAHYKATSPPRTLLLYAPPVDVDEVTTESLPPSTSLSNAHHLAEGDASGAAAVQDPVEEARREAWQLVPLSTVRSKRQAGEIVQYEIQVAAPGPIGIVWDRQIATTTVVKAVESHCRFPTVAVRDQLVGINDKNVSLMGPHQVVVWYTQAAFPKRLVFRTARGSANSRDDAGITADEPQITRLVVQAPPVLKDWVVPLDVAEWSTSMASTNVTLVAASPVSSCFKLRLPPAALGDVVIVVAIRGGCSFTDKAHHVLHAKGDGVVLANNVAGPGTFPRNMPRVDVLPLPVAMMPRDEGDMLLAVLEFERASATWERMPASKLAPPLPTPRLDHSNVDLEDSSAPQMASLMLWHVSQNASTTTLIEYIPALFGTPVRESQPFQVVYSTPIQTACHRDDITVRGKGSVVVIRRGACSFGAKAKVVQQLGAHGMIVVSTDDAPVVLASEDTDVSIWAISIGRRDGDKVQEILATSMSANTPILLRFMPGPQLDPQGAT
ncbi:hypothetical protein, variant [Aphanomyces invadans]|uniref:PA domain-containing protein n=1 Tax=Aphanomyces invadans TaxID=157072 RepID=A0A024TZ43_9STRA|nr:hypothetical protein, variant [Aphanomyces invadans]ETV99288.1 hypothetical protein, variant [Aphanomyces invadans]|eukprot:XP_008871844.1 hypothetical protein, variant [Aphanomyces invadans]